MRHRSQSDFVFRERSFRSFEECCYLVSVKEEEHSTPDGVQKRTCSLV